MNYPRKWVAILAMATAFPSAIFILAQVCHELTLRGLLKKEVSQGLFFALICLPLVGMVVYALKTKGRR